MAYDSTGRAVVTHADIVAGLGDLGLRSGDMVQVHSALSSFGYVEGGADAVVDAFLELLGPDGTLMVPTFNHGAREAFDDADEVFDPRTTRSVNGAITEAVRLRPEAHRSLHPTHPYAAIGPRAEWLTGEHLDLMTFDWRSPLGKLVSSGGKICMFGVGMNACTAAHVAETRAGSRCMGYRRLIRKVRLPDGAVVDARTVLWRGEGACKLEWQAIEAEIRQRGLVRDRRIGEAQVMLFGGREMVEATYELALQMCPTCPVRPRDAG
ncbi:MAG: AAC(3) family N-acetyltransferase [Armatimonadota bacterium]